MFVLCPHCQFLAALDPVSGQPPLHCPRCNGLVRPAAVEAPPQAPPVALVAAVETLPTLAAAPTSDIEDACLRSPSDSVVATLAPDVPAEDHVEGHVDAAPELDTPATDPDPNQSAPAVFDPIRQKRAPGFVRTASSPATGDRRWALPTAIAGLTLLLLLQIILSDRTHLAADPHWRPLLSAVCNVMHCNLPPWREPATLVLLDRDVRPDPDHHGVLRVTMSFRNDARWPQPWPTLMLTLADADGRVVGARAFAPRDYLGIAPTQNAVAGGQSASIAMDVVEPTPRVVAFTFELR